MCGIVAVVRRPGALPLPDLEALARDLDGIEARLRAIDHPSAGELGAVAELLAAVDRDLVTNDGVAALVTDPMHRVALEQRGDQRRGRRVQRRAVGDPVRSLARGPCG